jgi:predicted  nucleic acid-binding Zn-ribbon protein
MRDLIEKLLILQDCDRRILRTQAELAEVAPQRAATQSRLGIAQAGLEDLKLRGRQLESERKKLELDVEGKKTLIEKYSGQQLLTRKNEEYRALTHEIDGCKEAIAKLEDAQLEFMEQAEGVSREIAQASRVAAEVKREADAAVSALAEREGNLRKQLDEIQSRRGELASAVEEGALRRYERLFRQRGGNVLVGINHAVCGGCHMKLPAQVLIACQTADELNTCPHCGRILYYTRDMELVAAE